ncbi:hypothetical protein ACIQU4_11590 [Streptomyces sp. NPDC090741]|uniref:hypothetical protein n=1 Tax=Streptomyces sp. NPDC090741 TaxID=3365967 RepID=UPI00381A1837
MLAYMDSLIGVFRPGGFFVDLTHHLMHALGGHMLGFAKELFDDTPSATRASRLPPPEVARRYPYVSERAMAVSHEGESVVGRGCDDGSSSSLPGTPPGRL